MIDGRTRLLGMVVALGVPTLGAVACSNSSSSGLGQDNAYGGSPSASASGSSATTTTTTSGTTDGGNADAGSGNESGESTRPVYEFKTSAQLSASIVACFGSGRTAVTAAMIEALSAADAGAGFLSPSDFTAGDDAVSKQQLTFDGDPSVARTGIRSDSVSLPVLAALQNVGNVVGDHCANDPDVGAGTMCDCTTHAAAASMLARCLPNLDPASYATIVDPFATSCAASPASAIASLVASTTFGAQ